jgi:hypothetical protein
MKDLENIYNTYLRISRTRKNLPYKTRKDFSNISDDVNYVTLLKLENFFNRNPYVNLNDFFEAPYMIYEDENHFDLSFYITQKAMKTYSLYQKKKTYLDPDSDVQRKAVLNGLEFIYKFCKENKISLDEYMCHKSNAINTVFLHLKEKNISVYNCLAFSNFDKAINSQNYELLEFMLGDVISKLPIFRTKLYSSIKCKKISIDGLKILKDRLDIYKN